MKTTPSPRLPVQTLNPTLWRTCRVLAGANRIKLLRQVHDYPGQHVAALAKAAGIGRPYASQEMRRIQSRGLLRPVKRGIAVVYSPIPDPQVPTAAPLLKAIRAALKSRPAERDADMARIAAGLAHERRIALARSLMQRPKTQAQLLAECPMAPCSLQLHLRTLAKAGFVATRGRVLSFQTPDHPLGQALAKLLRQGVAR